MPKRRYPNYVTTHVTTILVEFHNENVYEAGAE